MATLGFQRNSRTIGTHLGSSQVDIPLLQQLHHHLHVLSRLGNRQRGEHHRSVAGAVLQVQAADTWWGRTGQREDSAPP